MLDIAFQLHHATQIVKGEFWLTVLNTHPSLSALKTGFYNGWTFLAFLWFQSFWYINTEWLFIGYLEKRPQIAFHFYSYVFLTEQLEGKAVDL